MAEFTTEEIDAKPSRRFTGYDHSEHERVDALMKHLMGEYIHWAKTQDNQKRIKNADELELNLKCLCLALFKTYSIHPELLLSVSLGNETISSYQDNRYRPQHITYKLLSHAFNFLKENDFFELPFGIGRKTGAPTHQRATRVKATHKLLHLFEAHGINQYMINTAFPNRETIFLRKSKVGNQKTGDDEQYEDTKYTIWARRNLNFINKNIQNNDINLFISDKKELELVERLAIRDEQGKDKYLDLTDTWMRRIFNNSSFKQGGRFYGGFWQNIPKEYRFLITINGDNTVQYDYSGMHFSIMYIQKGLTPPEEDPYQLNGVDAPRSELKKAFNMIINCETYAEAIGTINQRIESGEFSKTMKSGEALLKAFQSKHKLINDFIATGHGVKLQFIDSEIAARLLGMASHKGICVLPIHDGFITTVKHEQTLIDLMHMVFKFVMGEDVAIKAESIYPHLIEKSEHEQFIQIGTEHDGLIDIDDYNGLKASSYSSIVGPEYVEEQLKTHSRYYVREKLRHFAKGA